jgi:hypothetical protein
MKRGTPNHPKTRALAAALDLPVFAAAGVLECLWHFAAQYARRGDVGRYPDTAIESAIDWRGEPGALVAALVGTGFLDRCSCHRLRVHDWPEHADRAVGKTEEVKRRGWLECYSEPDLAACPLQTPDPPAEEHSAEGLRAACDTRADDMHIPVARVRHACVPPLPLPLPEPTDPPHPPGATAPGGEPPLEAQRSAAVAYWIRLGGRPGRRDRRAVWDALAAGTTLPQVLGSIAERVRDQLVAAGKLAPADPWPPPGLAPYDPPELEAAPPSALASPGEIQAAAEAWGRVSEALRAKVTPQAWATWIRPCRGLYLREGRLQLEVPGPQHFDWIGRTWTVELQWAAAEAGLEGLDLVLGRRQAVGA